MLKLKQNCRYGVAAPTSMGVRITPENGLPVHISDRYFMQATSAESNVVNVSAALGYRGLVLTNFVEGSPISAFIKSKLRERNIDYEGPDIPQGGPWGYRHQFNIADSGYGTRGPRVHNDRAGEVGAVLKAEDFDLDRIFGDDGVAIVHMSGLIAAISPETCRFCLEVARAAKKYGTAVSFDLNYRASFWKGREEELSAAFREIAEAADVLVGNEEDFQLCLGFSGPEAGGRDLNSKIDSFKEMIEKVRKTYSGASVFATTLRQVVSANEHKWGSIALIDGQWNVIEPRSIGVLDRIGGGDGYVGGLLYSLLRGFTPEKCNQFAWGSGALAATLLTDYATPADENMIMSIYEGNARVKR